VTLKLKFDATTTHTAQRQLEDATDNEAVFGRAARELLRVAWSPGTPVRLVGVGVSDFSERPLQLRLFDEAGGGGAEGTPPSPGPGEAPVGSSPSSRDRRARGRTARSLGRPDRDERMRDLSVTADRLRERFGKNAVSFGRDLRMRDESSDTAPMNKDDD
jgi:DNA polymerase-4